MVVLKRFQWKFVTMVQISGKSSKPFWSMRSGSVTKTQHSLASARRKELRDIRYSISIGNLILGFNSVKVSCLIHYDTLITKCCSYFITKCNKSLLQNASVITNCDDLIIKCDNYYKMRRLLQIATVQGIMFRRGKKMKLKCKLRTRSSQYPTFSGDENLKSCPLYNINQQENQSWDALEFR